MGIGDIKTADASNHAEARPHRKKNACENTESIPLPQTKIVNRLVSDVRSIVMATPSKPMGRIVDTQVGQGDVDRHSHPELRALTGLRGVAATTVAIAHFQQTFANDDGVLMWHNAVDLFFCLSGITLSYVYNRGTFRFSSYLMARIARIYPLYFLTLIIAGAAWVIPGMVNPTTYPARSALTDFLLQTLMVNCWPVVGSGVHWNPVAWSISIEWFCYILLFPFLLFRETPQSAAIRLACMIILTSISYYLFVKYFDPNLFNPELHFPASQLSYWVNLCRGICGFTVGWIVFASFEKRDGIYSFCTNHSPLIWFGVAFTLFLRYCGIVNQQALVFFFPFVVLAATSSDSIVSHLLGSKLLHFLGVISYSIYMMHIIVIVLFVGALHTLDSWQTSILALGSIFFVSTGTYFAIELPARNVLRGVRKISRAPIIS
ncbi:peptidoglycan/LPS O-acetylase OafA/YrhL [Bradyrhizobium sp. USDA 4532]|uniref:acyltransferase family protein n=1 Tax=unclassified Bradyrhizobium TaxID=2631580 RepID=UPI00209F97DC|nr:MULTISPECIES: acyltransferase [unclassified Bradyrhizobium]MCP1834201.1 peptidoglycan/LPS O-acetylase OafA/YrhL [Bradyrhizobium sp. USDA 4545]MCP1918947.1 peptidoglycan/LPS O-acetylase OafA/YrhL [Bradyrhizobium sp. USDA 4532]